jgi:hypothetical protein
MTAQASDTLRYADEFYSLTGISPDRGNEDLFNPKAFGIKTCPSSTACWRGYIATYGLRGDQLVLEELRINVVSKKWEEEHARLLALKEARRFIPPHRRGPKPQAAKPDPDDHGPPINGVLPVSGLYSDSRFSDNYHHVGLPLPFSGGLMIGDDFVNDRYVHMGFQSAWKYRKVVEFRFKNGILAATYDRSADMAAIREANAGRDPDALGRPITPRGIAEWIGRRFDRGY